MDKEIIEIEEEEKLLPYEILITAQGEEDYYLKVRILALAERVMNIEKLEKIISFIAKIGV